MVLRGIPLIDPQTGKPNQQAGFEDATTYTVSPRSEPSPAGRPPASGVGSRSGGTRGRPRKGVQADESLIRKSLISALSVTNLGLHLTGNIKYQFTENEIAQLGDVWTSVIMHYPPLTMWFDKGNELTDWARALILTTVILYPKFTGIDLNKPVNVGANANGAANSGANNFGNNGAQTPGQNAVPEAGGTRPDGGNDWLGEDNPSKIFS